jgi:hypothetical protein
MDHTPSEAEQPVEASSESAAQGVEVTRKPHRGLHPPEVSERRPAWPLAIPDANDERRYSDLDDESSYSEYAWAFLRRNRFYQWCCDGRSPFPLTHWGYRPSDEHEFTFGLVQLKHYAESFSYEGAVAVKWIGIHIFEEQLRQVVRKPGTTPIAVPAIEFPRHQVGIVFDISPTIGSQAATIDIQIALARAHLHKLIDDKYERLSTIQNAPIKRLLRAQLRVADLLSAPEELALAAEPDPKSVFAATAARALAAKQKAYSSSRHLKIADIADLIPSFDLKRTPKTKFLLPTVTQRLSRASDLATAAWKNMYGWNFMNWLQFDKWPSTVESATPTSDEA